MGNITIWSQISCNKFVIEWIEIRICVHRNVKSVNPQIYSGSVLSWWLVEHFIHSSFKRCRIPSRLSLWFSLSPFDSLLPKAVCHPVSGISILADKFMKCFRTDVSRKGKSTSPVLVSRTLSALIQFCVCFQLCTAYSGCAAYFGDELWGLVNPRANGTWE